MIGAMLQFGGLRARMRRVEKEITPIDGWFEARAT